MTKPEILMMGPYPAWDLEELERSYKVHKLWEATDRAAFLSEVGGNVRAIATRGEIGASAELMKALPGLEIVPLWCRNRCHRPLPREGKRDPETPIRPTS